MQWLCRRMILMAGWMCNTKIPTIQRISTLDGPFKIHLDHYKYASRFDLTRR